MTWGYVITSEHRPSFFCVPTSLYMPIKGQVAQKRHEVPPYTSLCRITLFEKFTVSGVHRSREKYIYKKIRRKSRANVVHWVLALIKSLFFEGMGSIPVIY